MKMEKLNRKNILITGGAGFVGSNLAKEIKNKYPDAKITILDNYFTGSYQNISDFSEDITIVNASTWDIEKYFPKTF